MATGPLSTNPAGPPGTTIDPDAWYVLLQQATAESDREAARMYSFQLREWTDAGRYWPAAFLTRDILTAIIGNDNSTTEKEN
jgi:hypothetical protein